MSRFVAFLRAVNVGGRVVRMETLRAWFAGMGFANVETFIASGNVVFETRARDEASLQRKIEAGLHTLLGYEVHTFLRTGAEVAAVARCEPFTEEERAGAAAVNVAFLEGPLDAAAEEALARWPSDIDVLRVQGRELYWLCRERQSDSKFSNAALERIIKGRATIRTLSTLTKLAAKYPA